RLQSKEKDLGGTGRRLAPGEIETFGLRYHSSNLENNLTVSSDLSWLTGNTSRTGTVEIPSYTVKSVEEERNRKKSGNLIWVLLAVVILALIILVSRRAENKSL
ncbi:MAG: hypothetical protein ABEJ72_09925, partial [Candidatus Aenigmatarchaeota archaeon]